jgi:hypothetical protein
LQEVADMPDAFVSGNKLYPPSTSSGQTAAAAPVPTPPAADAPHPNELLGAISTAQLRNWRSLLTVTGGDQQATVNTLCAAVRALLDREIAHESRRGRDKAEAKHRATVAAQDAKAKAAAAQAAIPNAPSSATGQPAVASSADLLPPAPPATVFDQPAVDPALQADPRGQ